MAGLDKYFSVLALPILSREAIKVSFFCGMQHQYLSRAKPGLKRAVWYGIAAGVSVTTMIGAPYIAYQYTASNNLIHGKTADWLKGIASSIAALLDTITAFQLLRFLDWGHPYLPAAAKTKMEQAGRTAPQTAHTPEALAAAAQELRAPAGEADSAPTTAAPPPRDDGALKQQPSTWNPSSPSRTASTSGGTDGANNPPPSAAAVGPAEAPAATSLAPGGVVVVVLDVQEQVAADEDVNMDPDMAHAAALEDVCDRSPPTPQETMKIWVPVFTTVVRAGIESVLSLGGLASLNGGVRVVQFSAIPLPAFVGIFVGCLLGVFCSRKQTNDIKWLVIFMAVIIFFIAAGQVNNGTDAFMHAGLFGYYSPAGYDERPWFMVPMYDWSHCCNDLYPTGSEPRSEQNARRFFALAREVFGYQDKGTPLEVILYCCYWAVVFVLGAFLWWHGTLFGADFKHTREQRRKENEARRAVEAVEVGRVVTPEAC